MEFRIIFLLAVFDIAQCTVVPLSCEDISELVDGHNKLRKKVASGDLELPGAVKMNRLVWDEELANLAAGWASHNTFGHNPNRTIGSKRFSVGENIYQYSSTNIRKKLNIEKALESWFDEYHNYKFGPLQPSDFSGVRPQVGHFTQMAWAGTTQLGCAVSEYMENRWKTFLVVCNYGPSGNYIGETPYAPTSEGVERLTCVGNCDNPYGQSCFKSYEEN